MALAYTERLDQRPVAHVPQGSGDYTSSAFTTAAGTLLVAVIRYASHGAVLNATHVPTPVTSGLTWTKKVSQYLSDSYTGFAEIWIADNASSGSKTISQTSTNATWDANITAIDVSIIEFTGAEVAASQTGRTAAYFVNGPADPTTITLTGAPAATSYVVATMASQTDATGGVTPGTGWTEIADRDAGGVSSGGPYLASQVQVRTGSTSTSVTWDDVDVAGNAYMTAFIAFEIKAGTVIPTVPGAPTGVSGTAGDTQVPLTWTAPASDGDATITDYVVQYAVSPPGTSWTTFTDTTSAATSATVTGLTNDTAYVFRVAAVNSVGTGSYSTASAAVTPDEAGAPPGDIGGIFLGASNLSTITVGAADVTSVFLGDVEVWASDIVWESDFSEYAGTNVAFLPETGWESNDWDDGGHTYDSNWRTTNSGGNAYMHIVSASCHLHIDTGSIHHEVETDVKITNTTTLGGIVLAVNSAEPLVHIGVEFGYIESTSSNQLMAYIRRASTAEDILYFDTTAGLVLGGTYNLRARILDGFFSLWMDGVFLDEIELTSGQLADLGDHTRAGIIHFSLVGSAQFDNVVVRRLETAATVPDAPENVEGIAADEAVVLSWDAVTGGVLDYVVQYALASAPSSWTTFTDATSSATGATVTGLTNDVAYIFHVAAVNFAGQGTYSAPSEEVTPTAGGGGSAIPVTTDLIVWLDASTLVLTDGAAIATWEDQSPVGTNDATQSSSSSRPTYIASGINSLPTARFDGTLDYLTMPSGFSTWTAGLTFFVVAQPGTATSYARMITMAVGGSNGEITFGRDSTSDRGFVTVWNAGTPRYFASTTAAFANGVAAIYSLHIPAGTAGAANTGNFRKNNVDWGSGDTYVPTAVTRGLNFIAASTSGGDGFWTGDISEIAIYNRALDSTERDDVYDYLADKYGL